jgi:hypothetical protein
MAGFWAEGKRRLLYMQFQHVSGCSTLLAALNARPSAVLGYRFMPQLQQPLPAHACTMLLVFSNLAVHEVTAFIINLVSCKVDLTARLREILINYPEGTSILKEIVQVQQAVLPL